MKGFNRKVLEPEVDLDEVRILLAVGGAIATHIFATNASDANLSQNYFQFFKMQIVRSNSFASAYLERFAVQSDSLFDQSLLAFDVSQIIQRIGVRRAKPESLVITFFCICHLACITHRCKKIMATTKAQHRPFSFKALARLQ